MAWQELVAARQPNAKYYIDDADPRRRVYNAVVGTLLHDGQAEVDFSLARLNNAALDGWRANVGPLHYALGIDKSISATQDGWVGFGGRSGEHWFKFRLHRTGYLHWPSRQWTPITGTAGPNYNRANLSRTANTLTIGPDGAQSTITASTSVAWNNLWTVPGGAVRARWRLDGNRLKEEIELDPAVRLWIAANSPPQTPANQTWFGFQFLLDWSDIPRIRNASGDLLGPTDDFDDATGDIALRNAADDLLGLLPLDDAYVLDASGEIVARVPLQKRFYTDGGQAYLLVGARVDVLNSLPAGTLVYDPTISKQVGAGADDGRRYTGAHGFAQDVSQEPRVGYSTNGNFFVMGCYYRFTGISGLSGATVDVARVELYGNGTNAGTALTKIRAVRADAPAAPTSASEFDALSLTTAGVDHDDGLNNGDWKNISIVSVIQEIANNHDPTVILITHKDDGSSTATNNFIRPTHYETSAANAPKLYIEYTAAAGDRSVNVSDAITVGEAVTVTVSDPAISATDTVALAEVLTVTLIHLPAVTDDVALGEALTLDIPLPIAVTDAVTVAEATTTTVTDPAIAPTDDVSVGEAHTVTVSDPAISLSDDIPVGESHALTVSADLSIAETDDVTVAEVLALDIPIDASVTDAVTVAEVITAELIHLPAVTDTVVLAELIALDLSAAQPEPSVTDTVTVADTPTLDIPIHASVTDTVTVTDSADIEPLTAYAILLTDGLTLNEVVSLVLRGPTPASRTLIVPADPRTFVVPADNRTYIVES